MSGARQTISSNPAILLLICAILFGGASQQNALLVGLVELASIPVLFWAIHRLWLGGGWRAHIYPIALLLVIAAVPLVQLIPLPPAIWRQLPNRQPLEAALHLASLAQPWLPITLSPENTLRSVLALLPPAAIFLAVLCADRRQRLGLLSAILVLAVLSIALGAAQEASGPLSPLYVYNPSHIGLPIGLFSNRNHQAIFLLAALPIAALWATEHHRGAKGRGPLAVALVLLSLLIVGTVATRSRAGLILLGPAIAASLALVWTRNRLGVGRNTFAVMALVVLVAMAIAAQFLIVNVLPRFDLNQTPELRFDTWPQVVAAGSAYLPLGSGIGTFDPVFRSIEPLSLLQPEFWNHAHNEYLELWLETGWVCVVVLIAFGAWWTGSVVRAWKTGGGPDRSLQRAGAIITGLLLAHSIVDYPVRTLALACVFALACGLMADGEPKPRHAPHPAADRDL